jgi:hypothetical protein
MSKIYYESDFKIRETFQTDTPIKGFKFTYYVKDTEYVASWDGTTLQNCKLNNDGSVVVFFENHGLSIGKLRCKREFFLQDSDFPDGFYNAMVDELLDVTLTRGDSDFFTFNTTSTLEPPTPSYIPPEIVNNVIVIKQGVVEPSSAKLVIEGVKVESNKLYL